MQMNMDNYDYQCGDFPYVTMKKIYTNWSTLAEVIINRKNDSIYLELKNLRLLLNSLYLVFKILVFNFHIFDAGCCFLFELSSFVHVHHLVCLVLDHILFVFE